MNQWQINSMFATVKTVGDRIYKRGKIFQAGEYPDKNVNVTVEQLRLGVANFSPCPINIEHWHSVLDDKLGELVSYTVMDDGTVFGVTSIPKALADLIGDDEIPVSIELRHSDWCITGLAFAKNPRVTDAAVFAAFGITQPPAKRKGLIMDLKTFLKSAFSKAVDELPDDLPGAPSVTPNVTPAQPAPVVNTTPTPDPAITAQLKNAEDAKLAADAKVAELQKQIDDNAAGVEADKVIAAAKEFAAFYCTERHILPAQIDAVTNQYALAIASDNAGKSAFASDGKIVEGDAVKSLRAMIEANPKHRLTADFMGSAQLKAVSGNNPGGTSNMSAERRAELLAKSNLGRQVIKAGGNN